MRKQSPLTAGSLLIDDGIVDFTQIGRPDGASLSGRICLSQEWLDDGPLSVGHICFVGLAVHHCPIAPSRYKTELSVIYGRSRK